MNRVKWLLLLLVLVPGLVVADVDVCDNPEIDFGGANGTPQQVTSIVSIPDSFIIQDLQVVVEISHPFIGDLTVDLASPGGTSLRLHDSDGEDTDNILVTYSDERGSQWLRTVFWRLLHAAQ